MSVTRPRQRLTALPLVMAGLTMAWATSALAQIELVASLDGEWVRVDSTYSPNDTMRVRIEQGQATILRVPPTVARNFTTGRQLWKGIGRDGSVQVLGSDGNYHPGVLELKGSDELRLSVKRAASGDAQVWRRAGPAIDGEWVRIAVGDRPADRLRIEARPGEAAIRFLPAAAARHLRVGSRYWQGITTGTLEVLGDDGRYRLVKYTLGPDGQRLCVHSGVQPGEELWVRPGSEEPALAELAEGTARASFCSGR